MEVAFYLQKNKAASIHNKIKVAFHLQKLYRKIEVVFHLKKIVRSSSLARPILPMIGLARLTYP